MGQELGEGYERTRPRCIADNVMVYPRIPMLGLDRKGGAVAMKVGDAIRTLGAVAEDRSHSSSRNSPDGRHSSHYVRPRTVPRSRLRAYGMIIALFCGGQMQNEGFA